MDKGEGGKGRGEKGRRGREREARKREGEGKGEGGEGKGKEKEGRGWVSLNRSEQMIETRTRGAIQKQPARTPGRPSKKRCNRPNNSRRGSDSHKQGY